MVSKQGRQEAPIDPAGGPLARFAIELRQLREECGSPAYRELATWSAKVGSAYSDTTFSIAARGQTRPSLPVVLAYVQACLAYAKADEQRIAQELAVWASRWEALEEEPAAAGPAELPEQSPDTPQPHPDPDPGPDPDPDTIPSDDEPLVRRRAAFRPRLRSRQGALVVLGSIAVLAGLGFGARYIAAPGSAAAEPQASGTPVPPAALPAEAPPAASPRNPTTGENSRCARLRHVGGVAWSPCTRADSTTLDFAVWLSNPGTKPVTVKIKLFYVQAGTAHACPGRWGAGVQVQVAPGEMTTPKAACSMDKLPATAFQTKAWVITPNAASWGYREMSQTVHVQADGTSAIWADEA
ncbi:hypothetical protein R1T08_06910 [Streptomyces sp. SBC-4]|nr:hypothetical protein [Streptomyces sp. SBC-4]MDV5144000.1 hypothetical protein [Streptomyces sp. SBC-4]